MWFNNLLVYRLSDDFELDLDKLEESLAEKPARPCASQEIATYGFVPPSSLGGEDAPLLLMSQGYALICAQKEERLLPSSVVKDEVNERIKVIEEEQMRKVYKKERDQIKDEVIQAFLPRAFIKKKKTYAAIDKENRLIYVNASSSKVAEDLLSTVREVLGSLPITPLTTELAPTCAMTEWVKKEHIGDGFDILDRAVLEDSHEDGGKISAVKQDLISEEIKNHIESGMLVSQLFISWEDSLSFVLDKKMTIRNLRFSDLMQEQAEQDAGDSEDTISASFVLMMGTLRKFIPALVKIIEGK